MNDTVCFRVELEIQHTGKEHMSREAVLYLINTALKGNFLGSQGLRVVVNSISGPDPVQVQQT